MRLSRVGLAFLKLREGCELKAYQDTGGVWTVGYGHVGPEVGAGYEITDSEAERLLAFSVRRAERAVNLCCVGITLTQAQFDALISFVFNIGMHRFSESTLLRKLRDGDYAAAADEFLRWEFDNGRRIKGLVERRALERGLFLSGAAHV